MTLLPSLISSWSGSTCLRLKVKGVSVMLLTVHLVIDQWLEFLRCCGISLIIASPDTTVQMRDTRTLIMG